MRAKMIAGNLIAVLAVGLISYFVVSTQLEAAFVGQVDQSIGRDLQLFGQDWRLNGLELSEQVTAQAEEEDTRDVFSALDENQTRDRAFRRATEILEWLGGRNRASRGAAELVVITDDRGTIIARSQDRNRMHGHDLTGDLGTLAGVLDTGRSAVDVWEYESGQPKVLQVAIAPIMDASTGEPMGALVAGYDMSNGMAARASELLGRDVAFIYGDRVYSASLEAHAVDELRGELFGAQQSSTTSALGDPGAVGEPWIAALGDVEYTAVIGPIANSPSAAVAVVVLGNRTAEAERAAPTRVLLIMTGVGILLILIFNFLLASSFLKPIEQMEEGVLAVINGRTDLRLDIESAELGGLAYRINQLLNVFTGTPEADDDGRISSPPARPVMPSPLDDPPAQTAPPDDAPADDAELARALADEPEAQYYARLFAEYVAAKQAVGENVSNITEDKFVMRLQANERSLTKKHSCRMVRFQVQTKGTQVNLRPVVIR